MRVLPGPTKSNTVLAWSPDGRFVVAAGSGDGLTVWDVDAGTPGERVLTAGHGGEAMRFCPATGRLYVAFRSGGVWTFDPQTGEERRRQPLDYHVGYASPAVAADGRTVVLRRRHFYDPVRSGERTLVGYAVASDGTLAEVWSRPDTWASTSAPFTFTFRPHTDQLFGLSWRHAGPQTFQWVVATTGVVAGSFPLAVGGVALWALAPEGERVAWLAAHALYVQGLAEESPRVLPAGAGEFRRGLAWAPDGRTLAYTGGTAVRLLDAETLAEVRAFDWGTGKPRAVAFSPDGLRAAVSGDGGRGWVTVFDLE